jgi:pyruvate/2-oxoglutarate dehydrogenase complex dihydrolipoamide acyltransferase (E2) component
MALLQEIQVPLLAVNDTSLTVVEVALSTGAKVSKGDLLMVLETSKTTYDVEAETEGYIQYLCEQDRDYEVNEVVARIYSEAAEALAAPAGPARRPASNPRMEPPLLGSTASASYSVPPIAATSLSPAAAAGPLPYWEGETLFSKEAARLMAAAGLDKSLFAGKDFVSGADVLAVLQPPATVTARSVTPARSAPALPADPQKVIVEKLSKAKRREIEYLSDIQSTGLTSTVHSFVDTEGIFTHINRSHKYLKDSLLPVIIYEASRLLASYPLLNGYYTEEGVALYKEINIGFAIDIDKGLKVLKIPRSADMSITGLESTIIELSGRYLDDTLQIDDLSDITFTITDLSAEGVTFFQPLINKMNSAILGMSAIDTKLQRATLSLTFDHRVTEGKTAARFLNDLKDRLESYRQQSPLYQDISCFKCFKSLKEDLGGSGFARCITPEGKEGYICQTCFKGF